MGSKAIIVDIDGTLSDSRERKKLCDLPDNKIDFKKFYNLLSMDPVAAWCKGIMNNYPHTIILLSGRPDIHRDETRQWLSKNNVPYDELHMRRDKDYRTDWVIKQEIYLNKIKPVYDIEFCIDDRKQVVDMWRRNDLICLQCAEGDF